MTIKLSKHIRTQFGSRPLPLLLTLALLALYGLTIAAHRRSESPKGAQKRSPAKASAKATDAARTEGTSRTEHTLEPAQSGGSFNLTQSVVAGGGGTSAGGNNGLTGSIGQGVLGVSSGGTFSLQGGFWTGGVSSDCQPMTITPSTLSDGHMGQPYSSQLAQTGGVGAVTWTISSGSLPINITLNPSTGLLSGTPVVSGSFPFTVKATDIGGCAGTQAYTLSISSCPAITITPGVLPSGAIGVVYNQPLSGGGGTAPYGFTLTAGALANGINLSAAGLLSGTPNSIGTFNFTIRATDANNCEGEVSYSLIVASVTAYEADVAPRPNGSGTVVVSDWVQVGRFSVGLDTPVPGSEFQRGDCAPRATLGDGQVSVADWVQAGRYSVGLDPVVAAGGPSLPTGAQIALNGALSINVSAETQGRIVRAVDAEFKRGQIGELPVEFDALGNENALAFTLNYDAEKATFVDAVIGEGSASSAVLLVNAKQAAKGRVGIVIALPSERTFVAGTQRLLTLRFIPGGGEGPTHMHVRFDDSLISREIVSSGAGRLPEASYSAATITIDGSALAIVSAASFASDMMAPEAIAAAFGTDLTAVSETAATDPLPVKLGGTTVKVKDSAGIEREGPLFFISENQVNFQIPRDSALGTATVTVMGESGKVAAGLINILEVAPALFTSGGMAAGNVFRARPDGQGLYEPLTQYDINSNTLVAAPIDVGEDGEVVHLILYGTGIRKRLSLEDVKARIGGMDVVVEYAGPQERMNGLDQINLRLPRELAGRGEVRIEVEVDGVSANVVNIHVK